MLELPLGETLELGDSLLVCVAEEVSLADRLRDAEPLRVCVAEAVSLTVALRDGEPLFEPDTLGLLLLLSLEDAEALRLMLMVSVAVAEAERVAETDLLSEGEAEELPLADFVVEGVRDGETGDALVVADAVVERVGEFEGGASRRRCGDSIASFLPPPWKCSGRDDSTTLPSAFAKSNTTTMARAPIWATCKPT